MKKFALTVENLTKVYFDSKNKKENYALNNLNFRTPLIPVISNIDASPQIDIHKLRKNLVDQVTGTVRWRETMELANKLGVKQIIELGGEFESKGLNS